MTDVSQQKSASELRDWLRELKKKSQASYADIARAIGEEERTVKRWMPEKPTAKVSVPSGDKLLKLLDYFGVKLTPPAPRAVALSLMGELRELRDLLDGDEAGALGRLESLRRRLEALAVEADEARAATAKSLDEIAARLPPEERSDREVSH